MGLDWNPLARAKKGCEAEFAHLLSAFLEPSDDDTRSAHTQRFQEITEAPFETLGAPRVGYDDSANAWLLVRLEEQGQAGQYAEALRGMEGYYVLDLLPESPGLPVYSSRGYDGVDRYTFRGAFLNDVKDILGEELYLKAWATMGAGDLLEYGNALMNVARDYARRYGLQHLEHQRAPPDDDDEHSPRNKAHIMLGSQLVHLVGRARAWPGALLLRTTA